MIINPRREGRANARRQQGRENNQHDFKESSVSNLEIASIRADLQESKKKAPSIKLEMRRKENAHYLTYPKPPAAISL